MGNACTASGYTTGNRPSVVLPSVVTRDSVSHPKGSSSSSASAGVSVTSGQGFVSPTDSDQNNTPSAVIVNLPDVREETQEDPEPRRLTPQDPRIPSLAEVPRDVTLAVCGRVGPETIPREDRVICVYHFGGLSDSAIERQHVIKHVYGPLRDLCRSNGCDLSVVDLHLEYGDESVSRSFRRHVIQDCLAPEKQSILAIFMNEKYGVYWCPEVIPCDVMRDIQKKVPEDDYQFLLSWYTQADIDSAFSLQTTEKCSVYQVHDESYCAERKLQLKHLMRLKSILGHVPSAAFRKTKCISIEEEFLEEFVFSGRWPKERVVWLKRSLKNINFKSSDEATLSTHFDMVGAAMDEVAEVKLEALRKRLCQWLPQQQISAQMVEGATIGTRPEEPAYRAYLTEMAAAYDTILRRVVGEIFPRKLDFSRRSAQFGMRFRGISRDLLDDIVHQQNTCRELSTRLGDGVQADLLKTLERYMTRGVVDEGEAEDAIVHPLILQGGVGTGKSSVAAKLAEMCSALEGWTTSVCVMRFANASIQSTDFGHMLESIKEQLSILLGVVNSSDNTISELLAKVPEDLPLLLVVDGLESFPADRVDVTWVPRTLPQHIRVVLTVSSDTPHMDRIQNYFQSGATYVTIADAGQSYVLPEVWPSSRDGEDKETNGEGKRYRTTGLRLKLLQVLADQHGHTADAFVDMSDRQLILEIFKCLGEKFNPICIRRLLGYLTCSRYGLSYGELVDVLSVDDDIGKVTRENLPHGKRMLCCSLWLYSKLVLDPFLMTRANAGVPVETWRYALFRTVIREEYSPEIGKCQQNLLNYFDQPYTNKGDKNTQSSDLPVACQTVRHGKYFNTRKLEEMPCLLVRQGRTARLFKAVLFNLSWMIAKIEACGLEKWKLDMILAKDIVTMGSTQEGSLSGLLELVTVAASSKVCNARDLVAQCHFRLRTGNFLMNGNHFELREMFKNCQSVFGRVLTPNADELRVLKATYEQLKSDGDNVIRRIIRIPGETDHVILLLPEKGELRVWNFVSAKVVRTFRGLRKPKDAKMCDMFKAVVLCDRELKIIDLDHGTIVCTLQGVLNIRMPYYGVHDKEHTIAIARNRMYVNMMNNNTGEMVTTFKVGEDRFMDSLLVSDNGSRCVCGDAVQKPFPLLVWDLNKRKLLYDLRIKGHEFVTETSAISANGEYVVCCCKELEDPDPTFLLVYDLFSGSMVQKWRQQYSVCGVAISSRARLVVSGHTDGAVCVWDLVSGSLRFLMESQGGAQDTIRLSDHGTRCVSYNSTGQDTTVRMWDVVKGESLGCFYPGRPVSCCEISPDGRVALVAIPGLDSPVTLLPPDLSHLKDTPTVFADSAREGSVYDVTEYGSN